MSGPGPTPTKLDTPSKDAVGKGASQASGEPSASAAAAKDGLKSMDFASAWARLTSWGFFEPGGTVDKTKAPANESAAKRGEEGAAKRGEQKDARPGRESEAAKESTPTTDAKGVGESEAASTKGAGENELKRAISVQAAKQKVGPSEAVVDARAAFEKAKAWTMAQYPAGDERATEVHEQLAAKHTAASRLWSDWVAAGKPTPTKGKPPKDPGPFEAYITSHWVSAYWFRRCYQFAARVQSFLHGPKKSLGALEAETSKAAQEGKADEVQGRTTHYRGMTLQEVTTAELAAPRLAPGTSLHVKLHFEGDVPYEFKDDFHHWVIYVGRGKFSDTLTGQDKAGAAHDASLKGWVKSAFKGPDFKAFHKDPRFVDNPEATKVVPKAGLQPRVSAEYDPRMSVAQKKG